jgi:ABC-type spermidine/putrescine transport system permease subunit II
MMFAKYTNLFGTITIILTVITGTLEKMGCMAGAADFAATCNIPFLPVTWMPVLAIAFGVLTFIGKISRPGGWLGSLFGSTAVVVPESKSGVGTVTPSQVASPK